MKNKAFILYGEPCDAFYAAFQDSLCIVRVESLPPTTNPESRYLVLMDGAGPCRKALQKALTFVRRVDGALNEPVSNLAAAMRGVVGVVCGDHDHVPPFRCVTNNKLSPYPPLLEDDLELSDAPALFRAFCTRDKAHTLQECLKNIEMSSSESTLVVSSDPSNVATLCSRYPNVTVAASPEAVDSTYDHLFFLQPPAQLVTWLRYAKPGARVHLFAHFAGEGRPETEELYQYRKQEDDLVHLLKLVVDNSLLFFNPDHRTNPYVQPLLECRQPPNALQWGKEVFRNQAVVRVREWKRLVHLAGGDVEEILDALLACDDVLDENGTKGRVRCVHDSLHFY
jgi:hypothetical protein